MSSKLSKTVPMGGSNRSSRSPDGLKRIDSRLTNSGKSSLKSSLNPKKQSSANSVASQPEQHQLELAPAGEETAPIEEGAMKLDELKQKENMNSVMSSTYYYKDDDAIEKIKKLWQSLMRGCKKKQPSDFEIKRQKEKERIRATLEQSIRQNKQKINKVNLLQKDGLNDSFFAGEEFKEVTSLNPNVNMKFDQHKFAPTPVFTLQYGQRVDVIMQREQEERLKHARTQAIGKELKQDAVSYAMKQKEKSKTMKRKTLKSKKPIKSAPPKKNLMRDNDTGVSEVEITVSSLDDHESFDAEDGALPVYKAGEEPQPFASVGTVTTTGALRRNTLRNKKAIVVLDDFAKNTSINKVVKFDNEEKKLVPDVNVSNADDSRVHIPLDANEIVSDDLNHQITGALTEALPAAGSELQFNQSKRNTSILKIQRSQRTELASEGVVKFKQDIL